jgi:hypothetical protein
VVAGVSDFESFQKGGIVLKTYSKGVCW